MVRKKSKAVRSWRGAHGQNLGASCHSLTVLLATVEAAVEFGLYRATEEIVYGHPLFICGQARVADDIVKPGLVGGAEVVRDQDSIVFEVSTISVVQRGIAAQIPCITLIFGSDRLRGDGIVIHRFAIDTLASAGFRIECADHVKILS